ncbi:MAG: RNA-directed DNA polymerase [Rhodoferax sp.]|uniref:RNA-directed DNA polymerase n=1 Tax=Rhodoferax sp. TaxID=50421 RepID=UPI0032647FB4
MTVISISAADLAIGNIAHFGDTDIFPFPIENRLFYDSPKEVQKVLLEIDADFEKAIAEIPILSSKNLSVVGYGGFRWGAQIDPVWNAYLLALTLTIASDLESNRVADTVVFSYRYKPDPANFSLFNKEVGWMQFQEKSLEAAKDHEFVMRCDISDFYPRIYHHRLENALKSATKNQMAVERVMKILGAISDGASYGLPVGGPASRILSEILLNRIDRLLTLEQIKFGRFVDDFVVFAKSREDAYSALIQLSSFLLNNEGLSLQKSKTRVMTSAEFLGTSEFTVEAANDADPDEQERTFRRLRVHYDPYSATADADYAILLKELNSFDIVGMLGRQLVKSRLDESLTRRLIAALKHLSVGVQNDAVLSLLKNLELLYPIFPSVMNLCRSLLDVLDEKVKDELFKTLRQSIQVNSYVTQVPTNLAYALRTLAFDSSEETEILLAGIYKKSDSMMLRRDIILMMAHRRADHWVSNCRKSFPTLTQWERRALLISSYVLGDEGSHWRDSVKKNLNHFDKLVLKWTGESKSKKGDDWKVPL